jgi:aldose 1-epimerase
MPVASETPSGQQFVIEWGDLVATITEVGGGLRSFDSGGTAVLWSYGADELCTAGRGQVLAPWPNRLEDGSYRFGEVEAQASLDEPSRQNAIHGLVRWLNWDLVERSESSVSVRCRLAAQPAYPWGLEARVDYDLSSSGLSVTMTARNPSVRTAPFGAGFHPYVDAGQGSVDDCRLGIAAGTRLLADDRGLPTGEEGVAGGSYDFTRQRPLAGVSLDDCFTGLDMPGSAANLPPGAAWSAEVARGDGSGAIVWGGAEWRYVMCFTGDTLEVEDRRKGIAIEPMTCPPNALRSGESLVAIGPGGTWSGRCGIIPIA